MSKFYTVMVVGESPDELMKPYDMGLKVEPYVKYRYLDADDLKEKAIKVTQGVIDNASLLKLSKYQVDYMNEKLKALRGMSSFEYYTYLTNGLLYDKDGNALTEENPNGKWDKYNLGANFSYPLKLIDGTEKYQSVASEVDWSSMHYNPKSVQYFERVWELLMGHDEPKGEDDVKLMSLWENKKNYLSNFKDKDAFVSHNCAYWCYAYLDKDGWKDFDTEKDPDWVTSFYERFVAKIGDDETITIFEFSRRSDD